MVSFQLDDSEAECEFMDSTGRKPWRTASREEGAVWLVTQFDEDEHADDKYRKVNVTDMTLEVTDGDERHHGHCDALRRRRLRLTAQTMTTQT